MTTELGAGEALAFLRDVDVINLTCRDHLVELTQGLAAGSAGESASVGSVKPDSHDVQDSPALAVAKPTVVYIRRTRRNS